MNSKYICHLTSVHNRLDTRVYYKEILSLKKHFYKVAFVVADGLGNDHTEEDIAIFDVGKEKSRMKRILHSPQKIYRKALELDADVYHFHDPELIIIGRKLLRKGKKVIYDIHEDVPQQLMGKPYLNRRVRPLISGILRKFENKHAARYTALIAATPKIAERFLKINPDTFVINNYPKKNELFSSAGNLPKKHQICYVGVITRIRGLLQLVDSLVYSDVRLLLAGRFESKAFEEELKSRQGWKNVDYIGQVDRKKLAGILSESKAGMVTFLAYPNHVDAQPNKIFEYMSAGLPVIGSDFELWKQIIADNNCGVCVNPASPEKIAKGINTIVNSEEKMNLYGKNGRRLIETTYNWEAEEVKLNNIYKEL
ncbi:MAG: glycosyltransferase family 4 protein [Bacteroidota bacterium]